MSLSDVTVDTDREGVIDAVLRLVEGIDSADEGLLSSAFTEDAVFDLSGVDPTVGDFKPYVGREEVVAKLMAGVAKLDTMHAVSNVRVKIEGNSARLTCYLRGEHFRPGQGPSLDYGDNLLLGNLFDTELIRDHDRVWLVRRHNVRSSWALGNVAVTGRSRTSAPA